MEGFLLAMSGKIPEILEDIVCNNHEEFYDMYFATKDYSDNISDLKYCDDVTDSFTVNVDLDNITVESIADDIISAFPDDMSCDIESTQTGMKLHINKKDR